MNKVKKRECQPCTACCDGWVRMVIDGVQVQPGCRCPHSTGSGCDDYENRPTDPCDNFNCGWVIDNSPLPDWLKPNNGKVIVLFNKLQWHGYPVDLAVPVGKRIPPRSLNWLKQFSQMNGRPLIYMEQIVENKQFTTKQTIYGHGPEEFQRDMQNWQESGEPLW